MNATKCWEKLIQLRSASKQGPYQGSLVGD